MKTRLSKKIHVNWWKHGWTSSYTWIDENIVYKHKAVYMTMYRFGYNKPWQAKWAYQFFIMPPKIIGFLYITHFFFVGLSRSIDRWRKPTESMFLRYSWIVFSGRIITNCLRGMRGFVKLTIITHVASSLETHGQHSFTCAVYATCYCTLYIVVEKLDKIKKKNVNQLWLVCGWWMEKTAAHLLVRPLAIQSHISKVVKPVLCFIMVF